jgi:hypothetical protein
VEQEEQREGKVDNILELLIQMRKYHIGYVYLYIHVYEHTHTYTHTHMYVYDTQHSGTHHNIMQF